MKLKLHLVVSLAIFTSIFQTVAQGTAFTYQGRLNSGGAPANGSFDLRFKLYADPVGTTQVGASYLTNAIPVTNGLFTTTIDFGAGIFNGANYWLEVDVTTNLANGYTQLTPFQALTPTPYAVFASAASNVSGTVSATQLSGAVGSANLSGTYGNALTLNNAGNTINGNLTGNGSGVTNVNSAALNGLNATNFWQLGGNNVSAQQFLGSANNQPLQMVADGALTLRLIPDNSGQGSPNIIGGSPANYISSGVAGSFIGGGGATNYFGNAAANSIYGSYAFVGGGQWNTNYANNGFLGGGQLNTVGDALGSYDGELGTVCGGQQNLADGYAATVAGGTGNKATGLGSFIGGGGLAYNFAVYGNYASGFTSVIGGGSDNSASGTNSTIPGGYQNVASGNYSFAAGQQAHALHQGTFVWADSQSGAFSSTANDQFLIRAAGGVQMDVSGSSGLNPAAVSINSTSGNGVGLNISENSSDAALVIGNNGTGDLIKGFSGNGNIAFEVKNNGALTCQSLTQTSDRNAKENFTPVDNQAVLAKVMSLPVTQWNYKADDKKVQHIGPMAQDFQAAFQLSADDKHISVVDEGGVALAAIQGLDQKLKDKDAEIEKLERQLNELQAAVKSLTEKK